MPYKSLVRHNPVVVADELEGIGAEARAREDEVRIHWRPGFDQPAEIDAGILGVKESVGHDGA